MSSADQKVPYFHGLSKRNTLILMMKFAILFLIGCQIVSMLSDIMVKSLKMQDLENKKNYFMHQYRRQRFLTLHKRNETTNLKVILTTQQVIQTEIKQPIFSNVTEQIEVSMSTIRSIKDVCFENSTRSIYRKMSKVVDLSFKPVSEFYVDILSSNNSLSCYKRGSDTDMTKIHLPKHCLCLKYYYGPNCDIPAAVWHSTTFEVMKSTMKIRNISKRVINGFLFNHEFDMLEARLHELANVIAVFVILECSFTSYGEQKPLRFYDRYVKGYLKEFSHKIIHVHMDMIPDFKNFQGHDVDRLLRCYLTRHGLARIRGTLEDDIFIISDADEILSADVVSFLKVYDVLTPVVEVTYKWNMYGFFWKNALTTDIVSVSTLKYLKHELSYYASVYRNDRKEIFYLKIGTAKFVAGWHCSWCFSPEGIVLKMNSAHNGDPPRLGDDSTKKNLTFIQGCIKHGRYFYDAPHFKRCHKEDYMYAPKYLMEHAEKYKTILEAP